MRQLFALLLVSGSILSAQRSDTPRHYLGAAGPLTAATAAPAEEIAKEYLRSVAKDLSLTENDLNSVYVAKQYRSEHNGVTHVVLRQRFQDADVSNAEWVVNIDRDGQVLNAGGKLYPAPPSRPLPTRVRAMSAARSAVAAVNPDLRDQFAPFESPEASRMRNGIRFSRGPLPQDVEGALVWYPHRGQLRPAWNFFVADSDRVHRYSVTVDDESQEVMKKRTLTFFQSAEDNTPPTPRGLVFDGESPQPNPTPGVRLTTAPPIVARVVKSFQGDPIASPKGWTDGQATAGNNVIAGENLAGTGFIRPTPTQSVNGDFSFPLTLREGFLPLNFHDAAVTNLFYWVNRAHDLHYQYGFDEQAGNFQADNFGRGGVGGDPLYAYAHYGAQSLSSGQFENAFFSLNGLEEDGVQPEISMFISGGLGPLGDMFTDGSYDSMVMIHEYTHGVSTRLARQVYNTFQGAAMGEAWSDFYGQEYITPAGAPPDGIYPSGQYFIQAWGNGIRSRPYSTNMDVNPITYATLGHVRSAPEVHADGEIWMEALWEIRANLIAQFGDDEGRKRVRQLVIDGMKLAVPQASMVDMRDAILLADRVDYKGASQSQLWAGFAKRGLGALAFSDGGDTVHVMSSFDLPSTTGQMKFYDSPTVINEPVRIVLQDSNNTASSAHIQFTGSSGDLEDLVLARYGSVFAGEIGTAFTSVSKGNGRLELASTDQISAYYFDPDTGSGAARLIQVTIPTMNPYALNTTSPSFTFSNENRISLPNGAVLIYDLPFAFPFYDKTYGTVYVYPNGLVAFERPLLLSACTDFISLTNISGISTLWTSPSATTLTGNAQPNEGLYTSSTPNSVTFRWAGEYLALGQAPSPTAFALTLFSDGQVQMNYGNNANQNVLMPSTFSECAAPTAGLSNGHDVYSATVGFASYQNQSTLHFNPPFHNSSLPTAAITVPKQGDHVQDILTVSGTATDPATFVSAVDVLIDGINRSHVTPTGASGAWTTTLNIAGFGLAPGDHTVAVRATNARGGFVNVPAVGFTADAGNAFAPTVAIEAPTEGATVSGRLALKGYAYMPGLRILSVDTLLDGFVFSGTAYGASRTDICGGLTPVPPNCPNIGFTGSFATVEATPPIPDGPHTLQVRIRDTTGRLTLYPSTPLNITVANGPAAPVIGVLESPQQGAQLSGKVTVTGYIYSAGHKITSATLQVDGISIALAKLGAARPDVCGSLPKADACPNIGFTVDLDTTTLLNGPHVLGIRGVNDRGDYATFPSLVNGGINVTVQN